MGGMRRLLDVAYTIGVRLLRFVQLTVSVASACSDDASRPRQPVRTVAASALLDRGRRDELQGDALQPAAGTRCTQEPRARGSRTNQSERRALRALAVR